MAASTPPTVRARLASETDVPAVAGCEDEAEGAPESLRAMAHRAAVLIAAAISTAAPAAARRKSPFVLRKPFVEFIVSVPAFR